MLIKRQYLKQFVGLFHGSLMIVFLAAYCWSGFHFKDTTQDKSFFLRASGLVEVILHDGESLAHQLSVPAKSFFCSHVFAKSIDSFVITYRDFTTTLFVSFLERKIFYVFVSIHAP
jgi:hypothetical protein